MTPAPELVQLSDARAFSRAVSEMPARPQRAVRLARDMRLHTRGWTTDGPDFWVLLFADGSSIDCNRCISD